MNQDEINQSEWDKPENWSYGRLIYFSRIDSRTLVPNPDAKWTVNLGRLVGKKWVPLVMLVGLPLLIVSLFDLILMGVRVVLSWR